MSGEEGSGGFLPPQAAGPEPELGGSAAPASQPVEASGEVQQMDWGQRVAEMRGDPGNDAAVAGFTMGAISLVLLFLSTGVSSVLSLALGLAGIVCGLRGRGRVQRGETARHRGLATASLWTGVAATVFSVIATVVWGIVLASGDFDFDDLDDPDGGGSDDGAEPAVRLLVLATRLVGRHLS